MTVYKGMYKMLVTYTNGTLTVYRVDDKWIVTTEDDFQTTVDDAGLIELLNSLDSEDEDNVS